MLITIFLNDDPAKISKAQVMDAVRDAVIGKLFLDAKRNADERYNDGLISAAEYARFLVMNAEDAHEKAAHLK